MNSSETFWLTVLTQTQTVFILVGVVIFMITPKPGRQEFAELGIILWMSLLTEIISSTGIHIIHVNMNLASNIFNLINLPVAVLLYRRRLNWKSKNILACFIIIPFVLFGLVNLLIVQGPNEFNASTPAVASVCFIVISVTYFYVLIQELPTESITRLPMFWINAAILIYYSGTFFVYLAADYLINVLKNNMIVYWLIHNFIGLIFYAILWHALLLVRADYLRETR